MVHYKWVDFFVADKSFRPLIGAEFTTLFSQGDHDLICGDVKFLYPVSGEREFMIANSPNNHTSHTQCGASYEGVFLNDSGNIVDDSGNELAHSDSDILIFNLLIGIAGIIIGYILEGVRRWLFF